MVTVAALRGCELRNRGLSAKIIFIAKREYDFTKNSQSRKIAVSISAGFVNSAYSKVFYFTNSTFSVLFSGNRSKFSFLKLEILQTNLSTFDNLEIQQNFRLVIEKNFKNIKTRKQKKREFL